MCSLRCAVIVTFTLVTFGLSASTAASADDLITLAKSGVDEEVVKAYIENSAGPFTLTSEDVVTLKDLGLSSKVIIEALKHDRENDSLLKADTAVTYPEPAAEPYAPPAVSAMTAPAPDDQNISFFYSALYPYGTWENVDGNWCWQPNATTLDDDWAPYCNHGHWVLTDYGWTWVSSYTWGWAPFHYGRWFRREHYGWLWQPDNEWGPAWVAWRTGDDYCGWAPLPPRARFEHGRGFFFGATFVNDDADFGLSFGDFYFVPTEHFNDRHLFGHVVPSSHAQNIYRRTSFEKNGYSYVNNHIVNAGVPVTTVEKATKTRIAPVTLTEQRPRQGEPIHSTTVSENKLIIYKPSISSAAPQSPVVAKERFTKSTSGYGKIMTPASNPQSWETMQKSKRNAAEQAAKNQSAAAQTSVAEKNRLNQQALKETDQTKQAALKGEEAVQEMKVQKAQQRAQRAQSWKSPQEIIVPRSSQPAQPAKPVQQTPVRTEPVRAESKQTAAAAPQSRQPINVAPVNRPTVQFGQQVRQLSTEARAEQQHRETAESTVRTQAQSQWQQQRQPQPAHQEEQPRKR
jgi:hypothetical protein